MKSLLVAGPAGCVKGKIIPSGDKSIAHRAVILSALTSVKTRIDNFPINDDCFYTVKAFKRLGVKIICDPRGKNKNNTSVITVFGRGLSGLKQPQSPIFLGESGTSLRVILGVLAGQKFRIKLTTAAGLSKRPMSRVTVPLRLMGALIKAKVKRQKGKIEEYPPIIIKGGSLKAIDYTLPVASAQVKSALLLASLYVNEPVRIKEAVKTRDHTERMLKLFGADIKIRQNEITIKGGKELASPKRIYIPGDISSAGFFMVLAAILSGSRILLKNVGVNPSRAGIIRILKRMNARLRVDSSSGFKRPAVYEPMGDLIVEGSSLKGTVVKKEEIPSLIDELPVLMVAACFAEGKTIFEGAGELRVKETDRINSLTENLRRMGADIRIEKRDGLENIVIRGVERLNGAKVKSFGDHRTAMSMVVAGSAAYGNTEIDDITCIKKSFPNFLELLKKITK